MIDPGTYLDDLADQLADEDEAEQREIDKHLQAQREDGDYG